MMRGAIIGFVGGAACLQMSATLPEHPMLALAAILVSGGAIAFLTRPYRTRPDPSHWCLLLALLFGVGCGFFWAALLAQTALTPELRKADEGRDVTLIGTIDSLPYQFAQGVRFNFAVEQVQQEPGGVLVVPPKISLGWYAGSSASAPADVQPGERWQLTVRLQRPHGNANPYGFDYEVWLLEQGLRATGYVRAGRTVRLASFVPSFGNVVERCRATLRARILTSLAGQPYASVIVALVVGDQRGIDQSEWLVFNRTGISHLISISGLHITMIAGLFAWIAAQLWRRSFFTRWQLPLLLPAPKVAALSGAAVALLYVLLAGFGVPAQRTLYMLWVVAAALWCGRITSVSQVLCSALGVVVLLDPWALLWPGFWLSFGAVAIILYANVGRTMARPPSPVRGAAPPPQRPYAARLWRELKLGAYTQYVVTLGLAPLTMLLFAQISLVSPVANAVAIPVISLIVTPLALAGSLAPAPGSDFLLGLAHGVIALLAQLLQWLADSPWAVWSAPMPSWWIFCWALAGALWLLAPRGWPQRWIGVVTWIPLLTALPARPVEGQLWVTAFDVGQGMALLLETSGHRLLYDTGPLYALDSNGGNRVILPYLKARGIDRLDGLIVSHSDSDHAGGALTIMASLPVGWVASSLSNEHAIVKAASAHQRCAAGQSWTWDGVRFEMLHPLAASYDDASLKPNARSCTLKISVGGKAILLAADIEAAQETELLARSGPQLRANILLAPHHGSGTSSTPDFLLAVQPELALFQVGYRNRYHHPKPEVLERYGQLGIARWRTDESGAITLRFAAQIETSQYRSMHARYWYGR